MHDLWTGHLSSPYDAPDGALRAKPFTSDTVLSFQEPSRLGSFIREDVESLQSSIICSNK